MKNGMLLGAVCSAMLTAGVAHGGTVFISSLSGANERPPVDTSATGTGRAELLGEPGRYVINYSVSYQNLSSEPIGAHIHYSVAPPGAPMSEQLGPIVEELDDFPPDAPMTSGTIEGDWRYDDRTKPLTDALVDSLFDGELYFNVHSVNFPDGEIRGQIVRGGTVTPIPLPAPLLSGLIGLGAVGLTVVRFRRGRRG